MEGIGVVLVFSEKKTVRSKRKKGAPSTLRREPRLFAGFLSSSFNNQKKSRSDNQEIDHSIDKVAD